MPKLEYEIFIESPKVSKEGKRVKWHSEEELETIKFFKLTDLPGNNGLSMQQVQEVQRHLANVPSHMVYSELQKLDMKLDRQTFEEQKTYEREIKNK